MYENIYADTDEDFYESLIYYGCGEIDVELIDFQHFDGPLLYLETNRDFMTQAGYPSLVLGTSKTDRWITTFSPKTGRTIYIEGRERTHGLV